MKAITLVLVSILGLLLTVTATQAALVWTTETVDSAGKVGYLTSLAYDTHGNPHVGYSDGTNGDLKHAWQSDGVWTIETVDSVGWVGWYPSLALYPFGNPHISYYDHFKADLKYASKNDDGSWTIETVDSAGDVGASTSLAFDTLLNPHISYLDGWPNYDLKYASKSDGVWTFETVDSDGVVGVFSSLALDSSGNPHISYLHAWPDAALKYAWKSGDRWTIDVVDPSGYQPSKTSLVLDSSGNQHIAYCDGDNNGKNGDLRYASKSGEVWTIETVDSEGYTGFDPSLAFDASGNPHISYFDATKFVLKHAWKSGERWTTGIVDSAGDVGTGSSLAFDTLGNLHISYMDRTNSHLKYASSQVKLQAPAANAGPDLTVLVKEPVTFNGAGSSDPDGSIVSYSWTFGDGSSGSGKTTTHAYVTADVYTVTLTVTDNDGLTGSDTAVITVQTPEQGINDLKKAVIDLHLVNQQGYIAKLDAALNYLAVGDINGAIIKLNDFINLANAQRGKMLTNDQADELIALAQGIINSIKS